MSNIDFTVNPLCDIPADATTPECEICGALADVEDTIYSPGGMKLLVTAYCEQCRLLISELVSRDLKNDSNDVARIVRAAQTAAKKSLRESARSSSRLECFDEPR